MDLSALKALPLGLLMFTVMVWGFLRRRRAQNTALSEYPALARRLQLDYLPPNHDKQIGRLRGHLRGFPVIVDPDDQRKLIVRFRGTPKIDFRSYEGPLRPLGMNYYTSRDRIVNEYFKTRYAGEEVARRLDRQDLKQLLRPALGRYRGAIQQLNITEHGVTCVVNFGNPPHIPAAVVEALLPALLNWAELIEPSDAPSESSKNDAAPASTASEAPVG